MRVAAYADNTLGLDADELCAFLNEITTSIEFVPGPAFRLLTEAITSPETYLQLSRDVREFSNQHAINVLLTGVPYANNYFFDDYGNQVLMSFSSWHQLTDLPISNGVVYMIAALLLQVAGVGPEHDETTGCVMDYLWDKTGIDAAMRAAFLCRTCVANVPDVDASGVIVADAQRLLDVISRASRANADVMRFDAPDARQDDVFDTFLAHNSADKPAVRDLNAALRRRGIRTWLDEEQLPLGVPWQPLLERQIASVRSGLVLVGASGVGPFQQLETPALLNELVTRGCPVVPVLLPEAPGAPELPLFMRQLTWLDLRDDYDDGVRRLVTRLRSL